MLIFTKIYCMNKWKKPLIGLGIICTILTLLFLFRIPIMRGVGSYLIKENDTNKADAIFVLSGGPLDRGGEAVKLYQNGVSKKIICTGENIPPDFMAIGVTFYESEVTKKYMVSLGLPDSSIELIKKGTSTREEEQAILDYCQQKGLKNIVVVSSKFHTHRISSTFKKPFEKAGIQLHIHGAPSGLYHEETWWENEEGMIACNNEYVKLMYYWLKY